MKFSFYNFLGGLLWSASFILLGYFFGKIPFIKEQLVFIVIGVFLVTIIPIIWAYFRYKKPSKKI
jgi:membrane-associated protein